MFSSDRPRYFSRNPAEAASIGFGICRRYRIEPEAFVTDLECDIGIGYRPPVPTTGFAPDRADIDVIAIDRDPNSGPDDSLASPCLDDYQLGGGEHFELVGGQ